MTDGAVAALWDIVQVKPALALDPTFAWCAGLVGVIDEVAGREARVCFVSAPEEDGGAALVLYARLARQQFWRTGGRIVARPDVTAEAAGVGDFGEIAA